MPLCNSCAAYLGQPEEILDAQSVPVPLFSVPSTHCFGRCASCGQLLRDEDDCHEQPLLEDQDGMRRPLPDLEQGYAAAGNLGGAIGGLLGVCLALHALRCGPGGGPDWTMLIVTVILVESSKGKASGEVEVKQGRVPGREFVIEAGKTFSRHRVYQYVDRFFFMSVTGTKAQIESKNTTTFLDSYKIPDRYIGASSKDK